MNNDDLLDKPLHELLGNRIGNLYSRGLRVGRPPTVRDLIDKIQRDGIFLDQATPVFGFRGEGIVTSRKLQELLDQTGFPWKDYIRSGFGYTTTQPTPQQLRMKIDSQIKKLIILLQQYQETRPV